MASKDDFQRRCLVTARSKLCVEVSRKLLEGGFAVNAKLEEGMPEAIDILLLEGKLYLEFIPLTLKPPLKNVP